MEIIDTHTHLQSRGRSEFAWLVAKGYKAAITCAFLPIVPRGSDTVLDHFDILLKRYCGEREGLMLYGALGIHPRCIPQKDSRAVLDELPGYLKKEHIVAMGEVGLDKNDGNERDILKSQLGIAQELRIPVILHTPRKDKKEVFQDEVAIIEDIGIDPSLIVADHCNKEIAAAIFENGFYAGISIGEGKITTEEAIEIIREYEEYADRIVLNTDIGYSSEYLYQLVDAIKPIEEEFGETLARGVACNNARRIFRL